MKWVFPDLAVFNETIAFPIEKDQETAAWIITWASAIPLENLILNPYSKKKTAEKQNQKKNSGTL